MASSPFAGVTPLGPRSRRTHSVAQELTSLIHNGHLKPGDKLPTEHDLCRRFGVSRTTLREAVQTLRTRGLLNVSAGRGSYITLPEVSTLLSDLTFTLQAQNHSLTEARRLLAALLKQACPLAVQAPQQERQKLFQHILNLQENATENLARELAWQHHLLVLANQGIGTVLAGVLHGILSPSRAMALQTPGELTRTIQLQLRATNAATEGDAALMERTLNALLIPETAATLAA